MSIDHNPMFPPEVPTPGQTQHISSPVPVVYENDDGGRMSLRTYAAIQLRVPDSGIKWLDTMIQRSRELDKASSIFAMQP